MTVHEFASHLPPVNASLNALTAVLLAVGLWRIKRGDTGGHMRVMLTALSVSALFLACYLLYHFFHGATLFPRHDWSRPLYFLVLGTHTVLAVVNLPLIFLAVRHAVRGDFARHVAITRWLWPSWMYVSVTGVLVYFMLYKWFTA
ncbi:MAG: DUF420 domain-containing protein [Verrucomicrobium sp.]|nr:DUF420 domain-containing protein [Verrucomicrobium sp.]